MLKTLLPLLPRWLIFWEFIKFKKTFLGVLIQSIGLTFLVTIYLFLQESMLNIDLIVEVIV